MSDKHLSDTKFADLNIHKQVLAGVESVGFEYCTPIQALALPPALEGKDVSGQAQTGTGKTAAFLIACFDRLLRSERKESSKKNPIRALILAPTRELAIQIMEDGKPLIAQSDLKIALAYGGTDYEKQRVTIEAGVDVLVGTPGRVIDYFKQGVFALDALEVIVLDEADRMFDLGFISDIRYLFRRMPAPEERLNLLFSATLSLRVAELAYEHMSEPEVVKVEAEITADRIEELAYMPANEDKIPLLIGLLKKSAGEKMLVFVNTKHMAEKVEAWVLANDLKGAVLSGDVPQKKRERLLGKFKDGEVSILIATDVAARGLHIPDVGYVINFDLPSDPEDYVHRIGRTARAGASGTAISLICETYAMNIVDIEAYIEHAIPVEKEMQHLIGEDFIVPDLSQLKSNRQKGRKEQRSNTRQTGAKNKVSDKEQKPRERREKGNPNRPPRNKKESRDQDISPEQREAAKVAAMEKRQAEPKAARRIPLRGRLGQEIPAIG
ncbi:MAG: DEAD/DEAH box helicase [Pseudomonadota bacterium]